MKKLVFASFAVAGLLLASCNDKKVEETATEETVVDTIATPADSTLIETPAGDTVKVETPADSTVVETVTETTTKTETAPAK